MEVSRVRGCQYKYKGYVISFMQNTPKVVNKLPSLLFELLVLNIKPSFSGRSESESSREFQRRFYVRCQNIQIWLFYLIDNHLDYQTMQIDQRRLSQLPEDGCILDDVLNELDHDEEDSNKEDSEEDEDQEAANINSRINVPDADMWPMTFYYISSNFLHFFSILLTSSSLQE